jgi:hypothetical protein
VLGKLIAERFDETAFNTMTCGTVLLDVRDHLAPRGAMEGFTVDASGADSRPG